MIAAAKVLIITVNFRHAECTLQLLKSASRLERFLDCHLVVVDNNSGDGSIDRIQGAISGIDNVELISSPTNRGYFGAAKMGLEHYLGRSGAPDWTIICNNDVAFDDPAFVSGLLKHNPQSVGLLAPSIISRLTDLDSNPMILRRPGIARKARYRLLLSNFFVAWLTQWLAPYVRKTRRHLAGRQRNSVTEPTPIYAPHGSFLIFSRRYFDSGGIIDDGCFLYAEEIAVAETCLRLGLPVMHDPALRVSHNDSQTTGRMLTRHTYLLQKQGLHYALGKYLESSRGA